MLGGKMVDNFMDKLAEKIGAQDIIRANAQAEAAEAERTRQEAEQFKLQLKELRENEKQHMAAIEEAKASIRETKASIEQTKSSIEETKSSIKDVRSSIEETKSSIEETKTSIVGTRASIDETVHVVSDLNEKLIENENKVHDVGVQVYRNVQAVVEKSQDKTLDEFKEQSRKLEAIQIAVESKNTAVLPVLIITLLVAGADLVINILRILGIL